MSADQYISELDERIVHLLSEAGPLDRDALVARLHVPRTTMYDHIAEMWAAGKLFKRVIVLTTRGRPRVYWGVAA